MITAPLHTVSVNIDQDDMQHSTLLINTYSAGLYCRSLRSNKLTGPMPTQISALTALQIMCVIVLPTHDFHQKKIGRPKAQHLLSTTNHACLCRDLYGNALTSQIPLEISALTRLTVLCAFFFTRVQLSYTLFSTYRN